MYQVKRLSFFFEFKLILKTFIFLNFSKKYDHNVGHLSCMKNVGTCIMHFSCYLGKMSYFLQIYKVEKIKENSRYLIPSPFPFFVFKKLLTTPSNVLLLHLQQTFLPIIWIFTEGDGIESMLLFKTFSTLPHPKRLSIPLSES